MTSNFSAPLHTWSSCTNKYIVEIHNIFHQHWVTLDEKRRSTIEEIDQWRLQWEKSITKYADKQKVLLNDTYDRLRRTFDKKYKENVETANAYHSAQQLELFKELRDACQVLEFQVAKLEYLKMEMKYPEVIDMEEQKERMKLEEMNTTTEENARRRRRRCKDNDKKTENNSGNSTSLSPNSIASSSKPTNNRQTLETQSKREDSQRTGTKNDSKKQDKNTDDSNDKCPICFMIFPLNLTRSDRHQHVNEHMIDDHDD
ncbi:unnamed protein product [Rotaria sp. Silwood1]|nr:unnamed protein product [Rotaria sp. Silwood1]CAF1042501.1 unnamed protein product [Rotaria sp. Silwood1]CAF1338647.1 unnamed protein product [Rotaria sp. Silwood1]CAF1340576.1 unnamed protein product [Rotaria sp. Silwood1]CAF3542345.1 unnamed protein product [Rotaria sp. Silwood1]